MSSVTWLKRWWWTKPPTRLSGPGYILRHLPELFEVSEKYLVWPSYHPRRMAESTRSTPVQLGQFQPSGKPTWFLPLCGTEVTTARLLSYSRVFPLHFLNPFLYPNHRDLILGRTWVFWSLGEWQCVKWFSVLSRHFSQQQASLLGCITLLIWGGCRPAATVTLSLG